jgi:hypothetical protein
VWFCGSEQASLALAAIGLRPGFTQTAGEPRNRGRLTSVGTTTAALDSKMRLLLNEFASNDTHGKARRLFDAFLKPQRGLVFWSDTGLRGC